MTDIVREFETYCNNNNIIFAYGSENHLNLIEGGELETNIYLLLFPPRRSSILNNNNTKIIGYRYRGKFMLLVPADYAEHYFNENEADQAESKYTTNIEPMLDQFESIGNCLTKCGNLTVTSWDNVDAINVLDANKDGLWCDYVIEDEIV